MSRSEPPGGSEGEPVYQVRLTRAAQKNLRHLRAHRDTIARALERLASQPLAGHPLCGSLSGARALEFTLKGSGAGRAAYYVLPERRVCIVFMIGPHEGFYKEAERRAAALDLADEPGPEG
ncbi:MAG: type II toxin-antitoxin system RelE/ParE family toxin [Thermomicrobiaceae bacterium]|nr:type II toxin-antitoxin system RelE/ParE family toxin [Thermomicrobiaceae bacterium]